MERRNRPPRIGLENISVLIIDDSRHMRELLRLILRELGVGQIGAAVSGEEGLVWLGDHQPDVVLVDWMMEPMDGHEFVRQVRMAPESPNRFVPIIMITGYAEPERVRAAREVGVTEFLAKPVSAKVIAQRIETIIHNPRPFIRTRSFFGPDRRRRVASFEGVDRRGHAGAAQEVLSKEDVEVILRKVASQ